MKIFWSLKIFHDIFLVQLSYKQRLNGATIKISEMAQPDPADVLESVKDLPTSGILAQDDYSGMLYLDLDNSWIYKSMTVLEDYGYIKPLGAHIRIVSEREAVDHELISESKGRKKIPWLGRPSLVLIAAML